MTTAESNILTRRARIAEPKSRAWTVGFFLVLMALVSRGFFENYIGKSAAYGVQLAAVVTFTLALLTAGGPKLRSRRGWVAFTAYAFVVVALLSAFASLALERIDYFGFYLAVTLFYISMLALYTLYDFGVARRIAFGPVIATVGIVLVVVALAQQFAGLTLFPGSDLGTFGSYLRPASLTGSFLHYPIAAALIAFLLLGIAAQQRKPIYIAAAAFVGLGVAASMSRSGIVILVVGLLVAILRTPMIGGKLRIVGVLLLGGLALMVSFPTGPLFERVMSIFDSNGAGNATRIDIWTSVVELWSHSPLFIGSHVGEFTNVTANLSGVDSGITESGVLQMLISWGLLGLIAFYSLMFGVISVLPRVPAWYFAGTTAGIVQSLVYQSIEVLPFMVLFAWYPLIASGSNEAQLELGRFNVSARGVVR